MKLIDIQPTLRGESVLIRPLNQGDFESLFEVAKDPKIWEQHPRNRSELGEFTRFFEDSLNSAGAFVIIKTESNQIIGSSRYKMIEGDKETIEIGWTFLSREFWGGACNQEVKHLMINHAFNYVSTVVLFIDRQNIRSQKAAEKIGAVRQPESSNPFNTSPSNFTYVITKANWLQQNP